jgi:YesN/AraC family two-component response regulator
LDQLNELTRYKIANDFGINQNYLSKKFKEDTGRTVLEFINFEKMKRVEKLLFACRDLSITNISEMAGFSTYNQFREIFKGTFGLNPWIYREARNNPGVVEGRKNLHSFESVAIYIITRELSQLSQLTRNRVAQYFGINKNYLGIIFKKCVKKTVLKFIEFEKLKRAEDMLTTKYNLHFKQIAQTVGMPRCDRFKKKFEAIYGLNPYRYRLLHKN